MLHAAAERGFGEVQQQQQQQQERFSIGQVR